MFWKRPIFISLSPNVEKDDISLSFKLLFSGIGGSALGKKSWKWKKEEAVELLEKKFKGFGHSFSFNSGRTAFLAILKSLELEKDDEVMIQAFTCNAVVNPIFWSDLRPVFIDIKKDTLNISPDELEKKISSKSKVVIVQHTFGKPAELDRILEICAKYNLILIEDCAHCLGGEYKGKMLGTFGKASFFSLGRDKIISSVYGGIAVTQDKILAEKIEEFQKRLKFPSLFWTQRQLLHPIVTKIIIMPFYRFFGIGKYFLVVFQRLKIISKAVHKMEKQGKMPKYLLKKMPNALAVLGLNQFKKLERFNNHRYEIAKIYNLDAEERIYMRYSIFVESSNKILKKFKEKDIYLNDGWRKAIVVPIGTNLGKMGYKEGSCPVAEEVAEHILNLPTHINISLDNARKIKKLLKKFQE